MSAKLRNLLAHERPLELGLVLRESLLFGFPVVSGHTEAGEGFAGTGLGLLGTIHVNLVGVAEQIANGLRLLGTARNYQHNLTCQRKAIKKLVFYRVLGDRGPHIGHKLF